MRIFCSKLNDGNGSVISRGSETAYALLLYAMRLMYGFRILPEIEKTANGKPYFKNLPDIHFSISHSTTHALCAVSACPVGADIESPRKITPRAVGFFASPTELSQFEPPELWVLKESFIKLYGLRLLDIKNVRFTRSHGVICAHIPEVRAALYTIASCHAAVCCTGDEPAGEIEIVSLDY